MVTFLIYLTGFSDFIFVLRGYLSTGFSDKARVDL